MVNLLANGSSIPVSASRLAHAMHDVLSLILSEPYLIAKDVCSEVGLTQEATTPGLNERALADCVAACRPKATPAERRVKELENTIRQLKANLVHERACVAELRGFLHEAQDELKRWGSCAVIGGQAGCRKDDTQVCEHDSWEDVAHGDKRCCDCGEIFR